MLAAYTGNQELTFQDYADLSTGKTLTAEPRPEPYDVAPASGRLVPDLPAGWFIPVLDDETRARIRDLYASGLDVPDVAREAGTTKAAVLRALSDAGVELRPAPEPEAAPEVPQDEHPKDGEPQP